MEVNPRACIVVGLRTELLLCVECMNNGGLDYRTWTKFRTLVADWNKELGIDFCWVFKAPPMMVN